MKIGRSILPVSCLIVRYRQLLLPGNIWLISFIVKLTGDFRAMTALSPLQFQKQLRLQEARRLMLAERLDAATASFQVGYESPSQFSREYGRLFGVPPLRDMASLRQLATSENA